MKILCFCTFIFVFSCSSSHKKMQLPSGDQGFLISCRKQMSNCYQEANHICPNGYHIFSKDGGTNAGVVIGTTGIVAAAKKFEMMIKCK